MLVPQERRRAALGSRQAVKTQTQLINEKTAKMGVTGWKKRKVTPETYAFQVVRSGFHYLSFGA